MPRKKIKAVMVLTLIVMCGIVFFIRYRHINKKYPEPTIEKLALGQLTNYYNVDFTVVESTLLSEADISKNYPEHEFIELLGEEKCMLVTVKLRNNSKEEQNVDLTGLTLESRAFSNGLDAEFYLMMTESEPMLHPTLIPGQELTVVLPYTFTEIMFQSAAWKEVDKRQFELALVLYPVKKTFLLDV